MAKAYHDLRHDLGALLVEERASDLHVLEHLGCVRVRVRVRCCRAPAGDGGWGGRYRGLQAGWMAAHLEEGEGRAAYYLLPTTHYLLYLEEGEGHAAADDDLVDLVAPG